MSLSMTESEHVAIIYTTKEALWIRLFLGKILHPLSKPMLLYCKDQSEIAAARMISIRHILDVLTYVTTSYMRQ